MLNIDTDQDRTDRQRDLAGQDRAVRAAQKVTEDEARRSNRDFTQVYGKGWARIRELIDTNPSAARIYTFLAEHMTGTEGAVVVSQDVMADALKMHVITVKRHTKALEQQGALVRIRVGTGVYAYALDPNEIWKSWDDKKELAAFTTKTLVKKSDRSNGQVRRSLKVMVEGTAT